MDANAVIGSGWIAASVPPQSTMSARPERIIWVPDAIASAPDAHAETGACAPARAPNSIDTYAAGEFAISIGTVIGSTRRAPLDFMTSHASSRVQIPPIPDATTVPSRSPSTSGEPASAQAWRAAIIAYCAEGSIRFISGRVSTSAEGTASWHANVTAISYFSAQSFSSVRTPDRTASAASHVDSTSPPSGVVAPRPVTTTVGVLLIGNSRDQAQIGRPQSADARSEVEGGGPQPCDVAMNETASPTVTRFLTSSSGIRTSNFSSASVTIVIIDSESMSRSSVKDLSGRTVSVDRPVSSLTMSASPARISCSVYAIGVSISWSIGSVVILLRRRRRLSWTRRSGPPLGQDDDLGGVHETGAEADLQGEIPALDLFLAEQAFGGERDGRG